MVLTKDPLPSASLLLNIPIEVRFNIYEFALAEAKPIEPRQVCRRSNKFVWGNHDCNYSDNFKHSDPLDFSRVLSSTEEKCLTITQLSQTCRTVYQELEGTPFFYRVNEFHFAEPYQLHVFLVAITPSRRAMIRNITLGRANDSDFYFHTCFPGKLVQFKLGSEFDTTGRATDAGGWVDRSFARECIHALTMLSECTDLKVLTIVLEINERWGIPMVEQINSHCHEVLSIALSTDDHFGFWSLPEMKFCTRITEAAGHHEINLSKPIVPTLPLHSELMKEPTASMIRMVQNAMVARKKRLEQEEENGNGWRNKITRSMRQHAFTDAKIDFPGEARVQQSMADTEVGAVSSRTRRRCHVSNVNSSGIIEFQRGKYSTTMISPMDSFYMKIEMVIWTDTGIKCQISPQVVLDGENTSWVPLERIDADFAIDILFKYYKNLMNGQFNNSAHLQELQAMPTPKEISGVTKNILRDNTDLEPRSIKKRLTSWNTLEQRYEAFVASLEDQVESEQQRDAGTTVAATTAATTKPVSKAKARNASVGERKMK
ncbi:uncharacterized protein BCR38DRAFT_497437 [Pseudomassariella vexata]|uniref:DUF7730 domain-containing protein n=1 Tax=Pseudomassariella vexata TaxID=1141098 RepID=A0A1Y2DL57_9PEZI|nr:uncharacterized protein BCR38DRAFT_497437 [Pseudomassariella vexata]ORY59967.1 hypothetical protein BCR38DRAFT_497437 [Pseudomassariella vexata]